MKPAKAVLAALILAAAATMAAGPRIAPVFQHPLIEGHGGMVAFPEAAHQPRRGAKAVLDVTSDRTSGTVLTGLDRAALLVNLHRNAGADEGLKLAVVLHGKATAAALNDEAYTRQADGQAGGAGRNPHLALIRELRKAGVEVFVCGQALSRQNLRTADVANEVTVAVSAAVANINLQSDGYAYLPFH